MNLNRLIVAMLALTIALQGILLYQQRKIVVKPPADRTALSDAPKGSVVTLDGLPIRGNPQAQIVAIEFSDYECPFCSRYATTVAKEVDDRFIRTGKIQYAFANNPLPMHRNAQLLAMAAICSGEQNHYWEMHDGLFLDKPQDRTAIVRVAENLGVANPKFEACLDGPIVSQIGKDQKVAQQLNLTATPGFAIGIKESTGRVTIKKLIIGAQPIEVFEKAILSVSG